MVYISGYRACSNTYCSSGCCSYGYYETSSDYACASRYCTCCSSSNCGSSSYGLHSGYRVCSNSYCSSGCCSYGYYETSSIMIAARHIVLVLIHLTVLHLQAQHQTMIIP